MTSILFFTTSLLLLSLTGAINQDADGKRPVIQPFFSCWYQHDDEAAGGQQQVLNLVFGYNNTYKSEKQIEHDSVANNLSPFYGNPQPTHYKVGHVPFAFTVSDVTSQLAPQQNRIQWTLGSKSVSVSRKDIKQSNRCATRFRQSCAPGIEHFCDDGSFCNGEEQCVMPKNNNRNALYGSCQSGKHVVCKSGELCDNKKRTCTGASSQSKNVISMESAKEAIVYAEEVACSSDADCASTKTYCEGQYTCDTVLAICLPANESYTPCGNSFSSLSQFYRRNSEYHTLSFPISIHCVEESKLCVQLFTCVTDSDCSDNLTCNGAERCLAGQCYFQADRSVQAVCHTTEPAVCIEGRGCLINGVVVETPAPNQQPVSNSPNYTLAIVAGCIIGVIILIAAIIILVLIYYDYTASSSSYFTYNPVDMPIYASNINSNNNNNNNLYNNSQKYGMPLRSIEGKVHVH